MNLRTPLIASVAVLSALGGVAAAAIALPSSGPEPTATAVAPAATPTPEVRTKTIRRTIHVVRRDKSEGSTASSAASSRAGAHRRARERAGRVLVAVGVALLRRLRPPPVR